MSKKIVFLLTATLFAYISSAQAEDMVLDKFNISIGGYSVFRTDATLSTVTWLVRLPNNYND